jgi:hypothetical protein
MYTSELPDAVLKAWGPEAAKDFVAWLDEYLRGVGLAPGSRFRLLVERRLLSLLAQ